MELIKGIFEWFRFVLWNAENYSDGYTEYLSEQPGIYINIEDVYNCE